MSATPTRSPSCAPPSKRAALALRDGEPTEPGALPRPPAEARAGRLQLQRGDAAGRAAGRKPARRRRAAGRPSSSASSAPSTARPDRGRRPRLRQSLPLRRLVPAGAGAARRGRRGLGPAPTPVAGADPGRVRLRQPDRAAARRRRPPRRLRRLRSSACCEAVGHEVEREYYVNDAGGQVGRFAASIAARDDRRGAARGRLRRRLRRSSWPSGSPPRGSTRPTARRSAAAASS